MADIRIEHLFDKPIYFAPPDHPDDIIMESSDSELSESSLQRKYDAIEHAAKEYLRGRAPFLLSAQLKGTATQDGKEWKNPWVKKSKVRKPQPKRTTVKVTSIEETNRVYPKISKAFTQVHLVNRNESLEKAQSKDGQAKRRHVKESSPLVRCGPESRDELSLVENSDKSRSSHKIAPRQVMATSSSAVPTGHIHIPPPDYHSNSNTPATLPGPTEEPWLKKRKPVSKKMWEKPDGGSPTPKTVAPEPTGKRKRPSTSDAASSAKSSATLEAESFSKSQDGKRPERGISNSVGPNSGFKAQKQMSSFSPDVDDKINSVERKSAGKAMSNKDREQFSMSQDDSRWLGMQERQQSSTMQDRQRDSFSQDRHQYPTIQSTQPYTMADSLSGFTNIDDKAVDSRIKPITATNSAPRTSQNSLDERPAPADLRDEAPAQSTVATPSSPQLGSFSKYQLDFLKFDVKSQSPKSDPGGFDFSFGDAINSQVPRPSVSKPTSPDPLLRRQNSGSKGSTLSQNHMTKDQGSSKKAISAPKLEESRAFSPKVRKHVQTTSESPQVRDGDHCESRQGKQKDDKTSNGRLIRSMAFEEDPSPGFLGPRQKRRREKTKLKDTQTQETRESSESIRMNKNLKAKESSFASQPMPTSIREASTQSEHERDHQIAREPPRITLSSVIRVNHMEDPGSSKGFRDTDEPESFQLQSVTEPPRKQASLVMSAIISEHISPEKAPPSPKKIDGPELARTSPLPSKSFTPKRRSPLATNDLKSKSVSPAFANLLSPKSSARPHYSRTSNPSTPSKSLNFKQKSPNQDIASRSAKSRASPMVLDVFSAENQQVSQNRAEDKLQEVDENSQDDAVDTSDGAYQHNFAIDATKNENSQSCDSESKKSAISRKKPDTILHEKEAPMKSQSSPAASPSVSLSRSTNSARSRNFLSQKVQEADEKNPSPVQPANASYSQCGQAVAWSYQDTTLSLPPSQVDSSTPMGSSRKGIISLGRSGIASSRASEGKDELTSSGKEAIHTSALGHDERENSAGFWWKKLKSIDQRARDLIESSPLSDYPQSSMGSDVASPAKEAREALHASPAVEKLLSSAGPEITAAGSPPAVFQTFSGSQLIQPSMSMENVEISSDDSEENIPSSRPAPISALRDSFLSPRKKRKRTRVQRRRRKPTTIYESSRAPSRPKTPAKAREAVKQPVAKTSIQAIDEDPMTQEEARLFAEFEAEAQSPWNVATEVVGPSILPSATMETTTKGDVRNASPHALSTASSRVPSDIQSGWEESVLPSATAYIPTNPTHATPASEAHWEQPASSCAAPSDPHDPESMPLVSTTGAPTPFLFHDLPPPPPRLAPPSSPPVFSNTQSLINAATTNPWTSTSPPQTARSANPRSKKRVSFYTDLDDHHHHHHHHHHDPHSSPPSKRRRILSPPPLLADDDSPGIDGPDDKLARKLRAARKRAGGSSQWHSSSPTRMSPVRPASGAMDRARGGFSSAMSTRDARSTTGDGKGEAGLGDAAEEGSEEDLAALVERDPDGVLEELGGFFEEWDVEGEVRKVSEGGKEGVNGAKETRTENGGGSGSHNDSSFSSSTQRGVLGGTPRTGTTGQGKKRGWLGGVRGGF